MELADSWYDWINWRHLGYQGPRKNPANGNSFVAGPQRGHLETGLPAGCLGQWPSESAAVNTELPLPRTDSARLTIHTRAAQPLHPARSVAVSERRSRAPESRASDRASGHAWPGEERQVSLGPEQFASCASRNPDLWWPYTLGNPNLYGLALEFRQHNRVTDVQDLRFGIRDDVPTPRHRHQSPELGKGGNFYLKVNGKDFPVRGAVYTPDLLFAVRPRTRHARYCATPRISASTCCGWSRRFPGEHLVDDGRRTRHPTDVRLDVLQPVGEVGAMGRRGSTGSRRTACARKS